VGEIEVLPSGRFRVRVRVNGKRKGDTFATRDEAERQRATLAVLHRATAEAMPPEPEALTLAAWGKTWLERRVEVAEVRHPQHDVTRWELHIGGSALDAMALEDIRPKHVTAWIDAMTKRRKAKGGPGRVSAQTIRRAFALLRLALSDAVRAELIESNPAVGAKLPKPKAPTWAFLTAAEIASVERGAPGVPEPSRRAFVVAIYTGLRAGELIALRWGDVTLDGPRPEVHVQRSHDGPPKSGKTRRVPLLPSALGALRAHRAEAGDVGTDDLVFPTVLGHQRHPGNDFGWSVKVRNGKPGPGYRVKLGVERYVRLHDLRHTCASHLAMGTWTASPWPLQDVARWLGHSSVAITERYAHLSPDYLHDRARGPAEAPVVVGANAPRGAEGSAPRPSENTGRTRQTARLFSAPRPRRTRSPRSA
jgi:integrase